MSLSRLLHHFNRVLVCASSVALVVALAPSVASAQPENRRTIVTFSAPVEIPGVGAQVLPAGTYVFKLLDSLSDRHIVQIFNRAENHIYATILAVPNSRLKPTDETVITFAERRAGDPQAIRAWFYPGDSWGQEFVYPKTRAVAIAAAAQTTVLYVPDEVAPSIVAPVKTATDPPVGTLKEAPIKAVAPTGADVPVATVVEPPPTPALQSNPTESHLPRTASGVPLLFLIGTLCLVAGLTRRALCAR